MHHEQNEESTSKLKEYRSLIIVLTSIIVGVVIIQNIRGVTSSIDFMRIFMGLFFIVFGFFKTLDLKGFVMAYAEYDIIAIRSSIYAYVYPFIELALGILYLSNTYLIGVNIVTVFIMGIGSIGVIKTLLDKRKIRCACLGTVVKLPMTTVTVIEDLGMGLMAAGMLVL